MSSNVPLQHQLERDEDETSKTKSNEDDDIKYLQQQQKQQNYPPPGFENNTFENNKYEYHDIHDSLPSISPQQLILDKMMHTVGTHYHNRSQPSSPGTTDYLQQHEGPIAVQDINSPNINSPNNTRHKNKTKSKSKSKSKSSSKSSSSKSSSSAQSSSSNASNSRSARSLLSRSAISEEPEYFDGEEFHNKYTIGGKINEGGFGSVWKIKDNALCSKCVKIMDLGKDKTAQNRRRKACIREFKMTQKAFTDEVVEVELYIDNADIHHNPRAYLIMPYFEGKDLFEFIDDDDYFNKVKISTMLHIFYKVLEKLYDLHYYKHIVHGDLKPENVMILQTHNSDGFEVEIIDYGIAKSIRNLSSDEKFLKSKGHFGTKGYVAPELMKEFKYNRKIDVFSAGVVLYNMVTECCLFPKGHKYYKFSQSEYYKYLKKKFKCIKKKKQVIDLLYSCLAFDPEERMDVKQLIQKYFHSRR